jgi:predicted Zn-dependent protease
MNNTDRFEAGTRFAPRIRLMAALLPVIFCCSVLLLMGRSAGHGAYHDVVTALSAELQKEPDDAALHYRLAVAHADHEEWQACLEEVVTVERLAPGAYPTGYLRGLALHAAGKDDEAKRELDAFLITQPKHVNALATRGRVLMKLGDPAAASQDFQKAIQHSVSPTAGLVSEAAKVIAAAGNPEDASKLLDERLKANGDDPELLACALEIDKGRGAWDAALRRVDALQKTAPKPEPWMARRAELLHTAGRPDEARAAWTALRAHLLSLPNLERGTPLLVGILAQTEKALGNKSPSPVIAAPSSPPKS